MCAANNSVTKYKVVIDEQKHRETILRTDYNEIDAIRHLEQLLSMQREEPAAVVGAAPAPRITYRIRCVNSGEIKRWEVVKDEQYTDIRVISTCDNHADATNVQRGAAGSRVIMVMEVQEEVKLGYFQRLWNALTDV